MKINNLFNINSLFCENKIKKSDINKEEKISLLEQGGGFDTITFSSNQTKTEENWQDIAQEWKNYTSSIWGKPEPEFNSIEDREQYWMTYYDNYINYCNRILACDDLPEDDRAEWSRMKDYASRDLNYHYRDLNRWKSENDMQTESYKNVYDQLCNIDIANLNNLSEKENTLSLIDRMLSCDDVPDNIRTEYQEKYTKLLTDINNKKVEENTDNKFGTSFQEVFQEFSNLVPDSTSTIPEKELAISYINRMLKCNDITPELKNYWENKKMTIEMEIQIIKNEQIAGNGEKVEDVWKEFSKFTNKYFNSLNDSMNMEEKYENRVAYYNMYKSFINRFMGCTDITEKQRAEYMRMDINADIDLTNWERDYQRYKDSL